MGAGTGGRPVLTVCTVTVEGGNGEGEGDGGRGARLEETKVEGAGGEEGRGGSRSGNRVPVSPKEKEERVEMRIGGAAVALARSSELSLWRDGEWRGTVSRYVIIGIKRFRRDVRCTTTNYHKLDVT